VTEGTEKNEGAPKVEDQAQVKPATTDDVRTRIFASVQAELARLEAHAERHVEDPKASEVFCHAMEAIAAIKARVEVYVIQVEMAASTAAMATIIGSAMRQRAAQPVAATDHAQLPPDVADLLRKANRPGGNSPPGVR
jgi:hypothetical protein